MRSGSIGASPPSQARPSERAASSIACPSPIRLRAAFASRAWLGVISSFAATVAMTSRIRARSFALPGRRARPSRDSSMYCAITSDSTSGKPSSQSRGERCCGLCCEARGSGDPTSCGIHSNAIPFSRAVRRTRQANGHSCLPWISSMDVNLRTRARSGEQPAAGERTPARPPGTHFMSSARVFRSRVAANRPSAGAVSRTPGLPVLSRAHERQGASAGSPGGMAQDRSGARGTEKRAATR